MRFPDLPKLTMPGGCRRWLEIAALLLIVAAGIFFRLDDLGVWRQDESRAFFNSQPIHTTYDAWFYLGFAQDLLEDEYTMVDEKRGVPDSPDRPWPPPLLSVLAASLVKITGYSLSWIGALLPVVLGPLLAIPIYLLGRFFGGVPMGLSGALLSVLSPIYVMRSNIGRFDTDCLIVTLAALAALCFLHFGKNTSWRRYLYLGGGLVVYGLFLWWWDQAPDAVTAISLLPLGVALLFFYRPPKKEALTLYCGLGILAVILLAIAGPDLPLRIMRGIWGKFLYISKDASGDFPNIGITITEQGRPELGRIINSLTGLSLPRQAGSFIKFLYAFPLFVGLAGIVLLCRRQPKESLFLLSFFGLAALSFFANRFLLFLVPVYGLGLGFFLTGIWGWLNRRHPILCLPACAVILLLLFKPLHAHNRSRVSWPKEPGWIVAGMDQIRQRTPEDAIIWGWWDHGYALNYYARRATVTDGSIHGGERVVYSALPLTTESYRLAANFMQFFSVRGLAGMQRLQQACGDDAARSLSLVKEVMAAGPRQADSVIGDAQLQPSGELQSVDDWLDFFYPEPERPVYLFLDEKLPNIAYWWYWFGSWDVAKQTGHHPQSKIFYNVIYKDGLVRGSSGLRLNVATGEIQVPAMNLRTRLAGFAAFTGNKQHEKDYQRQGGPFFGMIERARYGLLMDSFLAESVFGKLFIRQRYNPRYFQPVAMSPPGYQLWEVQGDRLAN